MFGLISKKKWFRVSEENPQKYVIAATFFGWAGIHKFLQGNISNFLLYLITFLLYFYYILYSLSHPYINPL